MVTRFHSGPGSVGTAERALSSSDADGGAGMADTVPGSAENRSPVERGDPAPVPWLPQAVSTRTQRAAHGGRAGADTSVEHSGLPFAPKGAGSARCVP